MRNDEIRPAEATARECSTCDQAAHGLLRDVIEALPDAFAYYDADDRLRLWNRRYRAFYPRSAAAMTNGARYEAILRCGLANGEYADAEGREEAWLDDQLDQHRRGANDRLLRLAGGRWLRVLERPTPDGGRVGLRIDVTAAKTLEGDLQRERDFLRAILATSVSAVTGLSADGEIVYANGEAERVLGIGASAVTGRAFDAPIWRITDLDGRDIPAERLTFSKVIATGAPVRDDRLSIAWPDGRRRALSVNAAPLHAPGSPVRVVCAVTDITEELKARAALAAEQALLEARVAERTAELAVALEAQTEINRAQRRFVSVVSHEFRTPLAIIDGAAVRARKLLARGEPERAEDYLQRIHGAVARLTGLLETVLETARLEEGRIDFNPAPTSLTALAREAVALQADLSPGMALELESAGAAEIVADARLVRQILANMLSNAVKYSGDASLVQVRVGEDAAAAHVRVTDQGVGVPADELPSIFRRFFRARTAEGVAGTGLGLSLSKSLAEMHGGALRFESREGAGSTVTLTLPRTAAPLPR